jgi:hypothetical protein
LSDAGILNDFLLLVNRVGLTTYMMDESNQYAILTKIFVESFKFTNAHYNPSIAFKIYDRPITMSLERFCNILGIPMFGIARKMLQQPADLVELYRGVTSDDDRIAQRGKIRNIQLPAIRYFTYYLATSVLGRGNTSNISNYHLAFLATALDVSRKYNLGAIIAHRLASKGPIYGGIIAARIVSALELPIAPHDILLTPQRLDLAAMKLHHFVTANSHAGKLVTGCYSLMERKGKCLCHNPVCSILITDHGHARRRSWTSGLGCSASTYSMALWTRRKRMSWPITSPRTTPGRPRAYIRTMVLLRRTTEAPPHGRVGLAGIDHHLGQKPKLGGRYADVSLIYISYFVGPLYIHVSLSLLPLFLFLLSET